MNDAGYYHIREDWQVWEGLEIEGRFSGLWTLFIGDILIEDLPLDITTKYAHIYINPVFILHNGYKAFYDFVKTIQSLTQVTLSISVTPSMLDIIDVNLFNRDTVYFILIIDTGVIAFEKLGPLDSVRFQTGNTINLEDKSNIVFTVQSGIVAEDTSYISDKPVIRKELSC